MAAAHPMPAPSAQPPGTVNRANEADRAQSADRTQMTDAQTSDLARATERNQALVRQESPGEEAVESPFPLLVLGLPVEVDVSVPVRQFRVRHLLALAPGQVIESRWNHGIDLPLAAGDVQLAWTEFEVVDTRLAVRVTRVA
jgi:flagellar motor switch/type III secretory pathway protein FliN